MVRISLVDECCSFRDFKHRDTLMLPLGERGRRSVSYG